ncbi:MAG: KR domain-containing protein, partial [Symploca sp. SIO1B1]|nr:KR domain-containing protein [Symploca sp. SIO1B1]
RYGVFSLEDGLKLIAARGSLMQKLPAGGAMVSVMTSESKVLETLKAMSLEEKVAIAAINGLQSIVISGEGEAVRAIATNLESAGVKTKQLQVSHAFHSPLMEPMLVEWESIAQHITYNQPTLPIISNVTGTVADSNITTAQYWVNHVRQPVRFAQGMEALEKLGSQIFLELGPKPILLGMGKQCLPEGVGVWLPSLRPGVDEWQQILCSLGQLYVQGAKVDWLGFDRDYTRQKVTLPTYPFQRQRYWIETSDSSYQKNSSIENLSTPIVNLINQGETKALAQQLERVGNLSPSEVEFLPKLLELLVKQHQQQLKVVNIKDLLYEVEWRTKANFCQLLPPDYLLKPLEIEQKVTPDLKELVSQIGDLISGEVLTQVEELSTDYIVQALIEMGWSYKPGDSFSTDATASRLGIIPSQRQLFNRMLQILAEAGIVQSIQQQWQVLQTLEKVNPTQTSQRLLTQYPDETAILTLLHRCASQLSGVLRGEIDPLQLVFPQGDLSTATQFYTESNAVKVMNTLVQKSITTAIEKIAPSRGIRLLEIGAGTGGTTSFILPHLNQRQTEYVFTDIGTLFTAKAQERFQDYPFLDYKTLDIEVEPITQGFKPHQYDIIIAANVLHATTKMQRTLSYVHQLLAPGGMLVLFEATTRQKSMDLIFGLLEGWWKFEDYDVRPDYPLMSRDNWKQLLHQTGFTEVVTLPDTEGVPEILAQQSVIIAQADQTGAEKTSSEQRHWLILADTQGVAQELATQLRSMGDTCILVFAGEQYQQTTPTEFTINYHNLAEFEQLIADIAVNSPSIYGVVQCWTMDIKVTEHISSQELRALSIQGCCSTLSLVQALVKGELSKPPQLWLVTCGVPPILGTYPDISGLAQSSVWGIGKVIGVEHPELNCVQIDLDSSQTLEAQGLALFQEVWSEEKEDQVARVGNERYVARLIRSHPTTEVSLNFRENATYLITGNIYILDRVGRWMVSRGAKHLVLVGNDSPDNGAIEKLSELEVAGTEVVVELADVSEVESITGVLNKINHSRFPLAGVIHGAEMLSDGTLEHQTWSSFEKVMALKVQGAWHLHQLTQNQPLDFFVLFSSVASLFGLPSQGNHSVANAFLDSLAHYRRAMGLPGLSIHWGAVTQVGKSVNSGAEMREHEQALGTLTITEMLESLELLMSKELTEVGVVPINWSAWQERIAQWSLLKDWEETIKIVSPQQSTKNVELIEKLAKVSTQEGKKILVEYIQKQVRQILQINTSTPIDTQVSILELGFDSLTNIELRSKLESQLEVTIDASKIQQGPSIVELAEELTEQFIQDGYSPDSINSKNESQKLVDEASNWIAYHQPKPNAPLRLFCFHAAGSDGSIFQGWSEEIIADIEVLPIQLPGRQRRLQEKPFTDFVTLIQVLGKILSPYLDRPFAFFGHSLGAFIAFELAHVLEQEYNLNPVHLFLSGVPPKSDASYSKKIESLSQETNLTNLSNIVEIPAAIYKDTSLLQEFMKVFQADVKLLKSYNYLEKNPLSCPIYSFGGTNDDFATEKQLAEWSKYTSSAFQLQMFPGKHMFMFLKDNQKPLLDIISQTISGVC